MVLKSEDAEMLVSQLSESEQQRFYERFVQPHVEDVAQEVVRIACELISKEIRPALASFTKEAKRLLVESATEDRRKRGAIFDFFTEELSRWHNQAAEQETRANKALRAQFKMALEYVRLHAQQRKGPATRKQRAAKLDEFIRQCRTSGMQDDACYEAIKRECPELIIGRRRKRTDRDRPIMEKSQVFRQFNRRSKKRAA